MNKEIYDKFIDAEKGGEWKIIELFNRLYSEYQRDYKKMAELLKVLNDRKDNNIDNEAYFNLYLDYSGNVLAWGRENLNQEKYNYFCKIADSYSIIVDEQKKQQ